MTTLPDPVNQIPVSTDAVRPDLVCQALVELLTIGQHHHAATSATLTTVGVTRRALAAQHGISDPTNPWSSPEWRLAALTKALGMVADEVFTPTAPGSQPSAHLPRGLAELAAVALGWLDALPTLTPVTDAADPDDEPPF
jgi:hypothetical protein